MVKISADIGITINYSYDLTKEEVEKIKPLKTKLEPYWKEKIKGKLVRITDKKKIAELKKNEKPPIGYDVKLVDDLSGIDKGVKQFFLDFLITNTFLGDRPTSEAKNSEERYYEYMNIDEDNLEIEYPNNADKMLKELESCIKIVKTKIKSSDLLGAIVLLKENNLSGDILTEELSKRLKGLTVGDLTTDKVKEVVDEDYTKIEPRKRIAQKRVDVQLNDKKFAELPDEEKKKIIEDIQRMDNKILVAADQSNPIFNPKILEKYISTKTNEKGLSIIIDTKEYMKELFIDANLGDMDSDDFLFTKKAKNKQEDLDVKESIKLFKDFSKKNNEVFEWANNLVDKFVFVSAEREKEEGESSSKYKKYKNEREKQLEAREESKNNSTKTLEELDFPKEMIDDIIGLMNNSNGYIKNENLDPDDLASILEKIVGIYNEKEGGESEFSRITEEEFGVEEDNTDDVYVPPKNEEDNEEDEDLSKQLLKSVLKTITIIKNEKETRVGRILQGDKTVPKGSILLVERNFKVEKPIKILENSVSKLTEKDKQEEILDITRNVFGTDELGQIIYPMIPVKVVDRIVLNNLVAKEDERLIGFVEDFVSETKEKKEIGGYNLYSLFSETGKKAMLDTNGVIKEIQKEIENFKNEDKVKKRIIELIKEDAKPIKGLADIKSDILLRITPVKNQLEVGKFILNYKYNIDLKILESEELEEFLVNSIVSKITLPDSSKRQNYKANEDKARTSSKRIKDVLDGTKLLVDVLTEVFKENTFYEYTQNEATPLREEITSEDVDDFVLQFLSGSTNKQKDKIKSFLSEFNSNLRTLDNEIDKLESENNINISDLIKRGELNNPNLIKTIESYIEVIKELGLPESYYREKTVNIGGGEFTISPEEYEAYYEYYKVRNEPFIKWLEGLEEDEIKEIFEKKVKKNFTLVSLFVLDIITKIADMGSEYFKDDNIQEKLERYYDPDDDVYNPDFMGKILSLIDEEYQDRGIELDLDDIDDAERDPVTGEKPTDLFDDNQQMDMETAQDRYDRGAKRFEMTQPPKPSENIASDKDTKRYAEMVRRKNKKRDGTYYEQFGKMLVKSEDIESGYEDDLFYWLFFWMRDSSRQEIMQAFQDYSNLKFNFDGDIFFELIDDYQDISGEIFTDENINNMLATYQANFIEKIYNKELDKDLLETLEDLGFISILQEKGIPDFDVLFGIDFNPYGGTVDRKWRSSVQRTPDKLKIEGKPKKIKYKNRKGKLTEKVVPNVKYVPTRTNIRDRREATELLLDAKNKWQKFERRV